MARKRDDVILNFDTDDVGWEDYKFNYFGNPAPCQRDDGPFLEDKEKEDSDSSSKKKDRQWAELNHRKMKPRRTLMRKEGQSNLAYRGIQKKNLRYLKDLYITLLDMKWRWAVLIFFSGFFLCYFIFSLCYFFLSYIHGDLDNIGDPDFRPCINNMETFWDALQFSIETQSTIGYGTIYPNAECAGTLPVVFLQISVGFLMETLLLGFIFVKVARPKHRRHTLLFSRNACLCQENQHLSLQVRVGDIRNTHIIDTHVYGVLVKRYVSEEKYVYPLFQHEIEFGAHGMGDRVFLMWPMVLRHKITSESPLYTLTPEDLLYDKFELLVVLEGTIESTGEMIQARTSYTSKEILWGHRFARLEDYDQKTDRWCVDFVRFNNVVPSRTPRSSAQQLVDHPNLYRLQKEEDTDVQEQSEPAGASSLKRDNLTLTSSADTLTSDPGVDYSTASEVED